MSADFTVFGNSVRGAVRLVLIGSLSRWKARQKFSRIKTESEYGARRVLDQAGRFRSVENSAPRVTQR
jgi:hypothetical protein